MDAQGAEDGSVASARQQPSLGAVLGILVVAAGLTIGLRSLSDNSFLTHLATGRLILDRGAVPGSDPYTFTAHGEPWVVQSWLMSVLYATAERIGGLDAIRVLSGVLAGSLAWLAWRLLRPAEGVIGRLVAAALFIAVAAGMWAERPLMVGLVGFALLALATEGGLDPRWLLPVSWLWVNAHGSFPLGLVYLALVALGTRLDGRSWHRETRCLGYAVAGMLAGAIGPLGPRVLLFPLDLLQRQELLSNVMEWRAPTFDDLSQRLFIVQVVIAVVVIARRPSYRGALVTAVFTAAALLGARNVAVASLALLPAMATGLAGLGSLSSRHRPRYARALATLSVGLMGVLIVARLQQPSLNLDIYPVDLVAYLEEQDVDLERTRLAAPDFVGNFLEYAYGPGRRVFYDDRFDMFPERISDVNLALVNARPSLRGDLEQLDVSLVAVHADAATAQVLGADPGWRALFADETWTLFCHRGSDLGDASC